MKHKTFLLFLLVVNLMQAQRFRVGFTGGLCVTDIDGADTRDSDNDFHKPGFTVGGILNMPLNEKRSFQFEINYIQKGSTMPPDSLNNGYYKIALDYVEMPFLIKQRVKFNLRKKPVTQLDLEGGVSVGRMIRHNVTGSTNYGIISSDNLFNKTDLSLLFGADYNFSKNFYFCVRYSNSVIPSIKRNAPNLNFITYTFNRGNNMVWQFSFKFLFSSVGEKGGKKLE